MFDKRSNQALDKSEVYEEIHLSPEENLETNNEKQEELTIMNSNDLV